MIELSLDRVAAGLVWELEMLAAIRRMCATHQIDWEWCREKEQEVAELLGSVRKVIRVKGNVLVVKPKR